MLLPRLHFVLPVCGYANVENKPRNAEILASGINYDKFKYVHYAMEDGKRVKVDVPIVHRY